MPLFEEAGKLFEACGETFGMVEAEAGRLEALANATAELDERDTEVALRLIAAHSLRLAGRFSNAAEAYERAVALADSLPNSGDLGEIALEGLGAVLADSPTVGASRLADLADKYAAARDSRKEAWCRYQRADCLSRIPPVRSVREPLAVSVKMRVQPAVVRASCWSAGV